VEYQQGVTEPNGDGDWMILKLSDTNGTKILEVGYRDADLTLDYTSGSSWAESTYTVPKEYRKFLVSVNLAAQTYDLNVYNGGSSTTVVDDVSYNTGSDGKAVRITFGSDSTAEQGSGLWDHVKVYRP
jgi:hypothetical protein